MCVCARALLQVPDYGELNDEFAPFRANPSGGSSSSSSRSCCLHLLAKECFCILIVASDRIKQLAPAAAVAVAATDQASERDAGLLSERDCVSSLKAEVREGCQTLNTASPLSHMHGTVPQRCVCSWCNSMPKVSR